jgi:porin
MKRPSQTRTIVLAVILLLTPSSVIAEEIGLQEGETLIPAQEQQEQKDPGALAWPPDRESSYATGDWNGARTWLEDRGLAFGLTYTGEPFWNLHGGIQTTGGAVYEGLLDLFLEFSTLAAGLWKGGSLFFLFQNKHGEEISTEYVGAFQLVTDMEALNFTQISELWYRQSFLDDRVWVKVGKQEANDDFAGVAYGLEFINPSGGFSPNIPLASYPDQDLGVVLGFAPMPLLSVNLGVYDGSPDGNHGLKGAFAGLEGPMALVEPRLHYEVGGRPGDLGIGGWFNGTDTEKIEKGGQAPGTVSEAYGWYLTWDQQLWSRHPGDAGDEQGIWIFGQYGWAPPDRSAAEHYLGAGVQCAGLIPGRGEDVFGVGLFNVWFTKELDLPKGTETAIEFFYKVQLFGFLYLKPDLQYIINPSGIYPDALALGVRFGLDL